MTKSQQKKAIEQRISQELAIPVGDAKRLVKDWYEPVLESLMRDPDSGYQDALDENAIEEWMTEMTPEITDEILNRAEMESLLPPLGEKGLVVTPTHVRQIRSNKAVGFIAIGCEDFLKLTTSGGAVYEEILREAHPLDAYNRYAEEGQNILPPFLKVDRESGQVEGHEGRHRAAALCKEAPGAEMWVAIILTDDGKAVYYTETEEWPPVKTYLGVESIPDELIGEFRPERVRIDHSKFVPIER